MKRIHPLSCTTKQLILVLSVLCVLCTAFCKADRLVTLSTVKTRSLAMGGAFVSIKDDLASLDFNPAAFSSSTGSGKAGFSFFLNPLGPVIALTNPDKYSNWTVPLGLTVRGISFSAGRFDFGLLLGEESLARVDRLERSGFLNAEQYEDQRNASLGFSLALAPRVSLGMAGEAVIRDGKSGLHTKIGYRYGLILMPRRNLSVGFCYFHFPDLYRMDRFEIERLADESLNVGISYSPWLPVTLALDVRNVSNEGNGAEREPHVGIEVFPFKYLSMRGGYYVTNDSHNKTYSFGVGLSDGKRLLKDTDESDRFQVVLNTTFVWQEEKIKNNRWFLLSCLIRI